MDPHPNPPPLHPPSSRGAPRQQQIPLPQQSYTSPLHPEHLPPPSSWHQHGHQQSSPHHHQHPRPHEHNRHQQQHQYQQHQQHHPQQPWYQQQQQPQYPSDHQQPRPPSSYLELEGHHTQYPQYPRPAPHPHQPRQFCQSLDRLDYYPHQPLQQQFPSHQQRQHPHQHSPAYHPMSRSSSNPSLLPSDMSIDGFAEDGPQRSSPSPTSSQRRLDNPSRSLPEYQTIPLLPHQENQQSSNKRPWLVSPPLPSAAFNPIAPPQHPPQQQHQSPYHPSQQPAHGLQSQPRHISYPSPSRQAAAIPMPHFRGQLLHQRPADSAYQRRYFTPAPPVPSVSSAEQGESLLFASPPMTALKPSAQHKPSLVSSAFKGGASHPETTATGSVGLHLGRLLMSTKQSVGHLLESFLRPEESSIRAIKDVHPNLEHILVNLLNGMLMSHKAFAAREHVASQEQQDALHPPIIRSFAQLRSLLATPATSSPAEQSSARRKRPPPHTPSRLSQSTSISQSLDEDSGSDTDTNLDTNRLYAMDSTAFPSTPDASLHPPGMPPFSLSEDMANVYSSTVDFLALMTAFVSVVCWLMQARIGLDRISSVNKATSNSVSAKGSADPQEPRGECLARLQEYLGWFDDQDNILKPIMDALSLGENDVSTASMGQEDPGQSTNPSGKVGLFAWHFYLFADDPEGPLEKIGKFISLQTLVSAHFDVILNELYSTHVLSMTAKEHQKDHGQFYTPPAVVDFMWSRTIYGRENLLDGFIASFYGSRDTEGAGCIDQDPPTSLIPTALDPCLGVSTFLSCYIRLLIQKAQMEHSQLIWDSIDATRLLLNQICHHVWGIELDGFAFWMARCGIMVALMPLVKRIQSLFDSHGSSNPLDCRDTEASLTSQSSKLPRLHLFRSDTLQLAISEEIQPEDTWEQDCMLQLRNPSRLQFDFIVTNPPYMIRKTGIFSAPDPEVYDWSILGASANAGSFLSEGTATKPDKKVKATSLGYIRDEEGALAMDTGDETFEDSESDMTTPGSKSPVPTKARRSNKNLALMRPGAKGMMQAYGYFIWFAAQRIKPKSGVVCMITASQWLTLEFATKLRAWLFENCLMDEFFQFEPFKVFSKVQTDSLIFKFRTIPTVIESDGSISGLDMAVAEGHRTLFLRHTDHHKSLTGILQDYADYSRTHPRVQQEDDSNIMASEKTREELAVDIVAPVSTSASESSSSAPSFGSFSFAPMMPTSVLTTVLLALTRDLGGICSAGTKRVNRLKAIEPLLWHRGPNTNPVYGLVVRMEYAHSAFGEAMARQWFRPALYWNGKNSPESGVIPGKALHKEGQFWQSRDRFRLSKKEGSPAEAYLVPPQGSQRAYALCMVDKESVKALKKQVEQGTPGSAALWAYLTDVRNHFQPGYASKKRKVSASGKLQGSDDEGVAYCSTNQCGADVPEKIIHPINYGYFSKTQPRQRFFLDNASLAVTNQCIYLTINKLSHHYDPDHTPPLIYFLTLLNSTTLQFFVLHHCQYDQQGRMRLFRESMAKIPFQDRDVKNSPARIEYAAQLGQRMVDLKSILYRAVVEWRLTGNKSHGPGNSGSTQSNVDSRFGSGGNHGILDWIRRGGDEPSGLLARTKEQVRNMLSSTLLTETTRAATEVGARASGLMTRTDLTFTDEDTAAETDTDTDTDDQMDMSPAPSRTTGWHDRDSGRGSELGPAPLYPHGSGCISGEDPRVHSRTSWVQPVEVPATAPEMSCLTERMVPHPTAFSASFPAASPYPHPYTKPFSSELVDECVRAMQALERAITMVELVQWAVDQYGYMLYGIRPTYQKLLELELKVVYGTRVEALVASSRRSSQSSEAEARRKESPVQQQQQQQPRTFRLAPLVPSSSSLAMLLNPEPPLSDSEPGSDQEQQYQYQQGQPIEVEGGYTESRSAPGPHLVTVEDELGITVSGLYRWDQENYSPRVGQEGADTSSAPFDVSSEAIPSYAQSILDNASEAITCLRDLLDRYASL